MSFHPNSAWLLALLPLAALGFLRWWRPRRRATVAVPSLHAVRPVPTGRFARLRWLPAALRTAALALIVVSLARPVEINESARTLVEGVAIELVVDRSDSMRAVDFTIDGQPANRLDTLKHFGARFIEGGDGLDGRPNDLIGIVCFGRNADSLVPLTLDHDVALDGLAQLRFPEDGSEMGTAIGDAVALAVDKLSDAAERANSGGRTRIKSKVLMLFTDGEQTAGELTPQEAAALAKSTDVRIYAVGVGRKGVAPVPVRTPFGMQMQQVPVSIDEKTLTEIATATGGRYFRATDSGSLRQIYETIDALEKSSIEETKSVRYTDLAVRGFTLPGTTVAVPPLLSIALALLLAEILLVSTRLRSLA
ncbi:MAG: VWA domain-containing protein [Planctomycetota bacterium]